MSHASIDRYLKSYKASLGRKKRTGTRPGKMFKNVIPLKYFDAKIDRPGHIEADTVAHCGDSMSGKFAWSLTFTDVYSGWTENRATYGKVYQQSWIFSSNSPSLFTRSHPYKKNDNCHVGAGESWYERYDLIEEVEIMNVI